MQPWGLLPVLEEENGFRLHESRTICRYITEKYADQGTQLPMDLEARGLFEQGLAMEAGAVDPCVFAALNEKLFKPFKTGAPCGDELYIVLLKRVELVLDVYEVILGEQRYIRENVSHRTSLPFDSYKLIVLCQQHSLADIY
ncbi:hypothetical protein DFH05DRAFT_1617518, partial [Lentinula detonsa]